MAPEGLLLPRLFWDLAVIVSSRSPTYLVKVLCLSP